MLYVVELDKRFDNYRHRAVFANCNSGICEVFIEHDAKRTFDKKSPVDGHRIVYDYFNGYTDDEIMESLINDYHIITVPSLLSERVVT